MSHAIRILSAPQQAENPSVVPSPGPPDFVAELLEERLQGNVSASEVVPGQARPMSHVNTGTDGVEHIRGLRRYEDAPEKATVLDEIEAGVVADAKWYRIEWHECEHGTEGISGGCEWSPVREKGSVPEEL